MVLGHLLPSVQLWSFLEWTHNKFWTVCSRILYHSSWTYSSCCRDVEGGNQLITSVSKTDQSGSVMFKSGDCAGQGRCWSSPSFKPWLNSSAVWIWTLSSWKAALFGNHGMHLITQPVHILPCSNLAMKGNNGTNRIPQYCCPNHHRTSPPMFHCWNQAFQIVGFLGCSPNVNASWCREQYEGWLIWLYHACISICLMCRFYGRGQ
jgi:hypothetical protein